MIGNYTFHRTIEDRLSNIKHTASGTLTIGQTEWVESGILNSLGNSYFYQNYLLEFNDGTLNVYYTNGNIFYALPNTNGTHKIKHKCGNDLYLGTWHFDGDILQLQWLVIGLHKNYTMNTIYTRTVL